MNSKNSLISILLKKFVVVVVERKQLFNSLSGQLFSWRRPRTHLPTRTWLTLSILFKVSCFQFLLARGLGGRGVIITLLLSTTSAVFSLVQESNTMEMSISACLSPKYFPWKPDNNKHFSLVSFSTYQQTAKGDRQGFRKWKALHS